MPARTIGARWRWFLIIGTIIACALFPVGISSNAANKNQDEKLLAVPNDANNAVKTEQSSQPPSEQRTETDTTKTSDHASAENTNSASSENKTNTSDSRSVSTVESAVSPAASSVSTPNSSSAAPVVSATGTVTLRVVVDGKARMMQVSAGQTLGRALLEGGVTLDKLDRVTPGVNTPVKSGQSVQVVTVRTRLESRDEKVAPGFLIQPSTKIAPGVEQVVQYGKSGTAKVTERVVYVGGKRVRKSFVKRQIVVPAQDKILALGTDSRFMPRSIPYHKRYARAFQTERTLAARGGSARARLSAPATFGTLTLRPVRSMMMKTSAYAAGPAGGSIGNYTATGMRCVRGAVATDPRVIPLGTKLYIEGYGYAFACDTGGAIKGNRIDLAFNSVAECFRHGRRVNRVWILSE